MSSNSESSHRLRVFLCHSSDDKAAVRHLYKKLREDGFEPWFDEEDLLPGQDWEFEITEAVRASHIIIACLSKTSINKVGYIQKELTVALDAADKQPEGTIFIIPLRLEDCDLPQRLKRWQWVNYFADDGYIRLVKALHKRASTLRKICPPQLLEEVESGPLHADLKEALDTQSIPAGSKDDSFRLPFLPEHDPFSHGDIEQVPPAAKTLTRLRRAGGPWLVIGLLLGLLITFTVVFVSFPRWLELIATKVKPAAKETQSLPVPEPPESVTLTDFELKHQRNGHTDIVWSVAFSPDGRIAASASEDQTIILWDTKTWTRKFPPLTGHTGAVYSIAFSPDGTTLASGSRDTTIMLWDPQTGRAIAPPLREHTKPVRRLAFSPDGKTLASCSGELKESDKEIRLLSAHNGWRSETLQGHEYAVIALTFSPDSNTLASASYDRTLRLWKLGGDGQSVILKRYEQPLTTLAFSSDGKYLACGSRDATIKLWSYRLPAQTWEELKPLEAEHQAFITSIAFSPDDKTLVSASEDGTIRLWDVTTGASKLIMSRDRVRAPQRSVAFSPDGQTLMTGGKDKMVRVWQ